MCHRQIHAYNVLLASLPYKYSLFWPALKRKISRFLFYPSANQVSFSLCNSQTLSIIIKKKRKNPHGKTGQFIIHRIGAVVAQQFIGPDI